MTTIHIPDDALRAAIDEGDASGVAEDSSLEGVLAEVRVRRGTAHDEQKMAALRAAIAEGDASPDAPPGVFERLRARY